MRIIINKKKSVKIKEIKKHKKEKGLKKKIKNMLKVIKNIVKK